jgi:hypothetical protein
MKPEEKLMQWRSEDQFSSVQVYQKIVGTNYRRIGSSVAHINRMPGHLEKYFVFIAVDSATKKIR